MANEFSWVGKATDRQDATDKVTGRVVYAGDIYLSGMLYGAALRSPHPHARIMSLDTAAALALPGVRAVLTAGLLSGQPTRSLFACVSYSQNTGRFLRTICV